MKTVAETPIFQRYASEVWTDAERVEFINWIAANPEAGDLYVVAAVAARCAGPLPVRAKEAERG